MASVKIVRCQSAPPTLAPTATAASATRATRDAASRMPEIARSRSSAGDAMRWPRVVLMSVLDLSGSGVYVVRWPGVQGL